MSRPKFDVGSPVKMASLDRRGAVVEIRSFVGGDFQYRVEERDGTRKFWREADLSRARHRTGNATGYAGKLSARS